MLLVVVFSQLYHTGVALVTTVFKLTFSIHFAHNIKGKEKSKYKFIINGMTRSFMLCRKKAKMSCAYVP